MTAATTDPQRLAERLIAAGWTRLGGRAGCYERLGWPNDDRRSLLIPLDRDAPEFDELLGAALAELWAVAAVGAAARQVLTDLYDEDDGAVEPAVDDAELMAAFGHLKVQFWICDVPGHSDSRTGDDGLPVVTVEWRGNVAHCTWPGCGRSSAQEDAGK